MTDFFGLNYTAVNRSQTSPIANLEPNDLQGRVRVFYDTYTVPAASPPAAADTIFMGGVIPKGARIVDGWVSASADLSDGTALLNVEIVTDAGTSTIITDVDFDAAGGVWRFGGATGDGADAIAAFVLDSDGQVQLDPSGDINTAAAVIKVVLFYVID